MKKFLIFLFILFLKTNLSFANPTAIHPDSIKNGDQINAITLLINNYSQFKTEWNNFAFQNRPNANSVEKAKVGETVHLITLFSNCFPDNKNQCNLSFKVKILRDNIIIMDSKKINYRINYPGKNVLKLSNLVVGSKYEPDEIGKYVYQVFITDENSHESFSLKTYINVTKN